MWSISLPEAGSVSRPYYFTRRAGVATDPDKTKKTFTYIISLYQKIGKKFRSFLVWLVTIMQIYSAFPNLHLRL